MEFEDSDNSGSGSSGETESPPPPLGPGGDGGEVSPPRGRNTDVNVDTPERSAEVPVAVTRINYENTRGSGFMINGRRGEAVGMIIGGKKKRGRPRKYDDPLGINVLESKIAEIERGGGTYAAADSRHGIKIRRGDGQSRGVHSGERPVSIAGEAFTTHIMTAHTGEDVAGKITTFALKHNRGVYVLSANGSLSSAIIHRSAAAPGGTLAHEGDFTILSLNGSYIVCDNGDMKFMSGGLSVVLACPDGRLIGGAVSGVLIAASPIQIVLGALVTYSDKTQQNKPKPESRSTTTPLFGPSVSTPPTTSSFSFPTPSSGLHVQGSGRDQDSLPTGIGQGTSLWQWSSVSLSSPPEPEGVQVPVSAPHHIPMPTSMSSPEGVQVPVSAPCHMPMPTSTMTPEGAQQVHWNPASISAQCLMSMPASTSEFVNSQLPVQSGERNNPDSLSTGSGQRNESERRGVIPLFW